MNTIREAQTWNAAQYGHNARFVAELGAAVFDWLSPRAGERILDLGCGDGFLTRKIADAGAQVVGADSSRELVEAARNNGIDARVVDGQALAFQQEFDAVFSNAALHWMKDAPAVIAGVRRALKPGGRFVAEMGGHGNVADIVTALLAVLKAHGVDNAAARSPWYFPTREEYSELLQAQGFGIENIALIPRPTLLPGGMRGWLETFANPFLGGFSDAEKNAILDEVTELLSHSLRDSSGRWSAYYMRLRFAAVLA